MSKSRSANVPQAWPGAFGLYKYAKRAVKTNRETLLWLVLLSLVFEAGSSIFGQNFTAFKSLNLIGIFINMMAVYVWLAGVRGKQLSLDDAFAKSFKLSLYAKTLLTLILVALALGVSFLLLIVPFFFVLPRVSLAIYFLLDKNMGVTESIQASWDATAGHAGKFWGIVGASIAMALLVVTVIGIPFALYFLFMYSAATAIYYEFVRANPRAK